MDPTLEAARIAAEASLKAARIGREGSVWGAVIQGSFTFVAGGLALWGGWLAYKGALRQAKLGEDQHAARVAGLRTTVARRICDTIESIDYALWLLKDDAKQSSVFPELYLDEISLHKSIDSDETSQLYILGEEFVGQMLSAERELFAFNLIASYAFRNKISLYGLGPVAIKKIDGDTENIVGLEEEERLLAAKEALSAALPMLGPTAVAAVADRARRTRQKTSNSLRA